MIFQIWLTILRFVSLNYDLGGGWPYSVNDKDDNMIFWF